jgi:hypothetical protein
MNLSTKGLFNRRTDSADLHFSRFLQLNLDRYRHLVHQAKRFSSFLDGPDIASACREWLPKLSAPDDRDLCKAIVDYCEATASSQRALAHLNAQLLRTEQRNLLQPCSYCSSPTRDGSTFLSGEPAPVCDATACHEQHEQFLDSEWRDFQSAGLVA